MNQSQKKYLKKLKRRKEKEKELRSQKNVTQLKKRDYALGRFAIFTVVGVVLGIVVVLNLFK